jgi:hypothetical protein
MELFTRLLQEAITLQEKTKFGVVYKEDGKTVDLDFKSEKEREDFIKTLKAAGIASKDIKPY